MSGLLISESLALTPAIFILTATSPPKRPWCFSFRLLGSLAWGNFIKGVKFEKKESEDWMKGVLWGAVKQFLTHLESISDIPHSPAATQVVFATFRDYPERCKAPHNMYRHAFFPQFLRSAHLAGGRLTCSHGTLLGINEEKEKECLVITLLPFFQTNSIALDEAFLGRVFIASWRRARLKHLGTVLRDFWRCFQHFNKEAYQNIACSRVAPVLWFLKPSCKYRAPFVCHV